MSPHKESFRQRFCGASRCRALFFVCSRCDRGQRYCSLVCQKQVRRLQWRAASLRHQRSPQGRLDHRDRQRAYRQRKAARRNQSMRENVTHHGSQGESVRANLQGFSWRPSTRSSTPRPLKSLADHGHLLCRFCQRPGRFVNPFYAPT